MLLCHLLNSPSSFLPISSATFIECQVCGACFWPLFCTAFLFVYSCVSVSKWYLKYKHNCSSELCSYGRPLCFIVNGRLRLSSSTNNLMDFCLELCYLLTYLFIFRGRGARREGEKHQFVVPLTHAFIGLMDTNSGVGIAWRKGGISRGGQKGKKYGQL